MSLRLSGINTLAYRGVEAITPPELVVVDRDPNVNDWQNFNIGTLWLNPDPAGQHLWFLISLAGNAGSVGPQATWVELYPGGAGGANQFDTDAGVANTIAGVIQILGGANINTAGAGNIVTVNLDNTIHWPTTDAGGTTGVIYLNNNRYLHAGGNISNTFLGDLSGNFTTTGILNVGIGQTSLRSLTSGDSNTCAGLDSGSEITTSSANCAFGFESLSSLSTGIGGNVAIGANSLLNLISGVDNVAIGFDTGINYTGGEHDNITISSHGIVGENNTTRIGTLQLAAYMAGIYNQNVGATNAPVYIDNTGKLGTVGGGTPASAQAFLATINANPVIINNATASAMYTIGTADTAGNPVLLSVIYDDGGNLFVGDGVAAPATFTAPITGRYSLSFNACFAGTGLANASFRGMVVTISTTARSYNVPLKQDFTVVGGIDQATGTATALADMTAGDTAIFSVSAQSGGLGVGQNVTLYTIGNANLLTWVSGYLVQ